MHIDASVFRDSLFAVVEFVAVCCSVLQCVAVCCSVLQYIAVCCSMLQTRASSATRRLPW